MTEEFDGDNGWTLGAYQEFTNEQARVFARDIAAYLMGRALLDGDLHNLDHLKQAAAHEAGHAVVAASYGMPVIEVAIYKGNITWGGHVKQGKEQVGKVTPLHHVPNMSSQITMKIAGYVGENLAGQGSLFGGAHEIAYVLYVCKYFEIHNGINPLTALRATLSESERIICENWSAWELITDTLVKQEKIEARQVRELVAEVKPATPDEWLGRIHQGGGKSYQEIEEKLQIAGLLARCAHQVYGDRVAIRQKGNA